MAIAAIARWRELHRHAAALVQHRGDDAAVDHAGRGVADEHRMIGQAAPGLAGLEAVELQADDAAVDRAALAIIRTLSSKAPGSSIVTVISKAPPGVSRPSRPAIAELAGAGCRLTWKSRLEPMTPVSRSGPPRSRRRERNSAAPRHGTARPGSACSRRCRHCLRRPRDVAVQRHVGEGRAIERDPVATDQRVVDILQHLVGGLDRLRGVQRGFEKGDQTGRAGAVGDLVRRHRQPFLHRGRAGGVVRQPVCPAVLLRQIDQDRIGIRPSPDRRRPAPGPDRSG